MSVIGFDIGNENCAIAVAKHGGIDVLLNDESKRETPAVVSFGEKQRFLGSAGAAFATRYPKSTISQIKRLIGRQFNEPSVQKDLKLLPFATSKGPRGGILIHLEYLGKTWTFMPLEILGMLFAHLKQLAEKSYDSPVEDCVIGIPTYFTDLQRREYLSAARIAGLRPLKLMHDSTATALGYGMYKTDFSKEEPIHVIFVDIGHSDTQVTVAAFEEGKMTILSHAFDQNLGGRDFDEVLFRHFASKFKEEYNIDVYSNARASIRLRASCEKLKKVLSANTEAPLSIECLVEDKDMNGFITREEFESLSQDLLDRVVHVLCKAGNDAGLSVEEIHSTELVGSGSRIPSIMRKLTSILGKEPVRTLNGSECVARGCALRCAMLSPTFQVKDYEFQDIFPYSIGLIPSPVDDEDKIYKEIKLFSKGCPFPRNHTICPDGNTKCYCQVFYTNKDDFPTGSSTNVGHFMVGPSQPDCEEKVKGVVKVKLNIHGIIKLEAIQHEEARRGWGKRQKLIVSGNLDSAMSRDEMREAQEKEEILGEQDMKVEQTKEKRNTLESFIYDTRSKLQKSYRSMATDSEADEISKNLQETEEWLYGEGDDESEQVYIEKLEDLKKLLSPIEKRYKDENDRKEATKALRRCIEEISSAADLLPPSQKNEINNECNQADKWLISISEFHDSLAKNATPVYCSSAISGITEVLVRRCEDIMGSEPSFQKYDEQKQNPDDVQVDEAQVDRLLM